MSNNNQNSDKKIGRARLKPRTIVNSLNIGAIVLFVFVAALLGALYLKGVLFSSIEILTTEQNDAVQSDLSLNLASELVGVIIGLVISILAAVVAAIYSTNRTIMEQSKRDWRYTFDEHKRVVYQLNRMFGLALASLERDVDREEWRAFNATALSAALARVSEEATHDEATRGYFQSYWNSIRFLDNYESFLRIFATRNQKDSERAFGVRGLTRIMKADFKLEQIFEASEPLFRAYLKRAHLRYEDIFDVTYQEDVALLLEKRNEVQAYIQALESPPTYHKEGNEKVQFMTRSTD